MRMNIMDRETLENILQDENYGRRLVSQAGDFIMGDLADPEFQKKIAEAEKRAREVDRKIMERRKSGKLNI